jgi:hypothetical protein
MPGRPAVKPDQNAPQVQNFSYSFFYQRKQNNNTVNYAHLSPSLHFVILQVFNSKTPVHGI